MINFSKIKNYAKGELLAGILSTDINFSLKSSQGGLFPSTGSTQVFIGVFWDKSFETPFEDINREIVKCYRSSGDTFNFSLRGAEGSLAKNWNADDNFALVFTSGKLEELQDEILASQGLFQIWDSERSYIPTNLTAFNGVIYVCTQANTNKQPDTNNTYWQPYVDPNNKGYFLDELSLTTAYPTGLDGWYAIVGATDSVWIWDGTTGDWVNSGNSATVNSVFGRMGVVVAQLGDYNSTLITHDKTGDVYITSDNVADALHELDAECVNLESVKENVANKTSTIDETSTTGQYPNAKATFDALELKATQNVGICAETPLGANDISINSTTRILTITPPLGYFHFFTDGAGVVVKHVKTGVVNFPAFTNTSGVWYFHFDTNGNPVTTQTAWTDFGTICTVYRIAWNATLNAGAGGIAVESIETHPNTISADDHSWKHRYGAVWNSGLVATHNRIASGTPNADGRNTCFALSTGSILDDNLKYIITNGTGSAKFEQDMGNTNAGALTTANGGIFKVRTQDAGGLLDSLVGTRFPFAWNSGSNRPEYITSTGVRTLVGNGNFFVYYIYAIQDPRNGETVKSVSSAVEYTTLANAQASTWTDIQALFPLINDGEIRPLYKLIYEYRTTYDVAVKYSALRQVDDLRKAQVTTVASAGGTTNATSVTVAPAGNISSTNAQSALEELDNEKLSKAVSGELNAMTEKTSLVDDDIALIEDSASSFAKKKVKIKNIGAKVLIGENLLENSNFINVSTRGYGTIPDNWLQSGGNNSIQGGYPSLTKQELIDILGVSDSNIKILVNCDGNFNDLSSNGYNLTATNSPTDDANGLMTQAKAFVAGSSQYATGSASATKISTDFTMIAIHKPTQNSTTARIAGWGDSGSTGITGLNQDTLGQLACAMYGVVFPSSGSVRSLTNVTPNTTSWNFHAMTHTVASKTVKQFINGQTAQSEVYTGTYAPATSNNFSIGRAGDFNAQYYSGSIQSVIVLSVALTEAQLKKLWDYTTYKKVKTRRSGSNCLLYASYDNNVSQINPNISDRLRGKTVTFKASIYQTVANAFVLGISYGADVNSAVSATTGDWVDVYATATIPTGINSSSLALYLDTIVDGTVWVKDVMFYEGSTPVTFWNACQNDWCKFPRLMRMEPPKINSGYQYEENRFYSCTPKAIGITSPVYSAQGGKFMVNGKKLSYSFSIGITSYSSPTGAITIDMPMKLLPAFTNGTNSFGCGSYYRNGGSTYQGVRLSYVTTSGIVFVNNVADNTVSWEASAATTLNNSIDIEID